MKKFLLLIGVMVVCAVSSCSDEQLVESSTNAELKTTNDICGEAKIVDLIAGQHINVGTVSVSNDDENLYVTYETSGNWYLTETHLFVGKESDIPLNGGGNPKIGHFPYSESHDDLKTFTYTIELNDLDECFSVVSHAVVERIENGRRVQGETAFGCGDKEFPGRRWGCYFEYCKQECDKEECTLIFGRKDLEGQRTCLNVFIDGESYDGWSNGIPYSLLLESPETQHFLKMYSGADGCDISNSTFIGSVKVSLAANGKDIKLIYFLRNDNDLTMSAVDLYVGPEENPYNMDGSWKKGITSSNFYEESFVAPIKESQPIIMGWSGDENSTVYIISAASSCTAN